MENKKRDILRRAVSLFFVVGIAFLMIGLIVYSKVVFDVGVICPFKAIFNLDCPGCGGTRMAVALLKLDFYQAFRYNVFVCGTLPFLATAFIWQTYEFIFNNRLLKWIDTFLLSYAIGLILFGILRNIEVFKWLAPTVI